MKDEINSSKVTNAEEGVFKKINGNRIKSSAGAFKERLNELKPELEGKVMKQIKDKLEHGIISEIDPSFKEKIKKEMKAEIKLKEELIKQKLKEEKGEGAEVEDIEVDAQIAK